MRNFILLSLIVAIIGCTSNNASKSFLYKEVSATEIVSVAGKKKYKMVGNASAVGSFEAWYSGNPVFIANDSKFSIKLDELYLGKLKPKDEDQSADQESLSNIRRLNNIKDKELWMLTTISSLNANDPLETNSKAYFKSTNVKMDSQSFSFFPFDEDEKYVFTHESDMSYRITFQLYSVDEFVLKRELAKIAKSPGISGIINDGIKTVTSTFGSIVGDTAVNYFKNKSEEPLATERFLLKADAMLEFTGQIVILRNNEPLGVNSKNPEPDLKEVDTIHEAIIKLDSTITKEDIKSTYINYQPPFRSTSYVLFDNFKPEVGCSAKFGSQDQGKEYGECDFDIDKISKASDSGYMAFSVMEGISPKLSLDGDVINFEKYQNLMKTTEKISRSFKVLEEYKDNLNKFNASCKDYSPNSALLGDQAEKAKILGECALLDEKLKRVKPIAENQKYFNDLLLFRARLSNINEPEWRGLLLRSSD